MKHYTTINLIKLIKSYQKNHHDDNGHVSWHSVCACQLHISRLEQNMNVKNIHLATGA